MRSQEEREEEAMRYLVRKERERERPGREQPTVMEIDEHREIVRELTVLI